MQPHRSDAHAVTGGVLAIVLTLLSATAVLAVCGDGQLERNEQCDDGNTANGDCCTAACTREPEGRLCDDPRSCPPSDACRQGVCRGRPSDTLCAAGLPSFLCFTARAARAPAGQTAFVPHAGVSVRDEFGTGPSLLDVTAPAAFCGAT